jgi:hypothetical protein
LPLVADDEYDWAACDSSEAEDTVVLLGAGASADAGLPVATQLYERIAENLPAHLVSLYRNIAGLVFGTGPVDVERLFRVIQFINNVETQSRPLDTRQRHESLDIASLVESWKGELQHYLNDQLSTTKGTPTGLLIDALYEALWRILWLGASTREFDVSYLKYLLLCMRGGTIVTLNYDNALEWASLAGTGVQLDAGPYPKQYTAPVAGWERANVVRVIKLHGFLGWKTNPNTGDVSEQDDNAVLTSRMVSAMATYRPEVPGIIFGAGNKLRADGPYLDLYVEFKAVLSKAQRLIVIGYGWNDEHVNEVIRRWLRSPQSLFRVSTFNSRNLSDEQQRWTHGNDKVVVQVIPGAAKDSMPDLIRASPQLQR